MKSLFRLSFMAAAAVLLASCDGEGITRPPPTFVRVVHAAPSFHTLDFLREARRESTLTFGEGENHSFDSDQYDFSFQQTLPDGSGVERIATVSQNFDDQNEYIVVVMESGPQPEILVASYPLPETGAASTRLILIHAAAPESRFDAYFEPVGTNLAGATAKGSAGFRESFMSEGIEDGDYELSLTPPGDPTTVLFRSEPVPVGSATSVVAIIADEGGRGTADFGVIYFDSFAGHLRNVDHPSAWRAINGIGDMTARDIYLDDDFSAPLLAGVPFGGVTDYASITPGRHEFQVTPVGNPGVTERTVVVTAEPGRLYTSIIGGNTTDGIVEFTTIDDHRPLSGGARLELYSAADQFSSLTYYVVTPGTDISGVLPSATMPGPASATAFSVAPGDYELTVRDPVGGVTVFGPETITLNEGRLYGMVTTDAVGGSTVNVTVFEQTM